MKLDVRAAALATGIIAALAYALCTAFCVFLPESIVTSVTTDFLHIDIAGLYRKITLPMLFLGLIGSGVGTAVAAGATACLYNRLVRHG